VEVVGGKSRHMAGERRRELTRLTGREE